MYLDTHRFLSNQCGQGEQYMSKVIGEKPWLYMKNIKVVCLAGGKEPGRSQWEIGWERKNLKGGIKASDFIMKAVGNDGNMQIRRGNLEVTQNASDMMQPSQGPFQIVYHSVTKCMTPLVNGAPARSPYCPSKSPQQLSIRSSRSWPLIPSSTRKNQNYLEEWLIPGPGQSRNVCVCHNVHKW